MRLDLDFGLDGDRHVGFHYWNGPRGARARVHVEPRRREQVPARIRMRLLAGGAYE